MIALHVAAFVQVHKDAQLVTCLTKIYASVYVKAAHLRISGMIGLRNVRETTRYLAFSRVAVNAQSTCSAVGQRLLTQTLANVCAQHLLVSVQRS